MTRLRAALSLIVLAGLIAGCGGSVAPPKPPSAAALVTDSARALRAQQPARFRFDTHARTDRVVPAPAAGPQVRRFTDSPLGIGLRGAYSPEAVKATGSLGFTGQTFTADALAGARELYVRFFGTWYGTRQLGLEQLRSRAEASGAPSPDRALDAAAGFLERYGDQVFKGPITRGPRLDGVATWQTEGRLDANGLVPLQGDGAVTPRERAALQQIASGTRIVYVVGRDDKLPRQMRLSLDLRPAELARSGAGGAQYLSQIERVRASVTANLSAWGEKVELTPPPSYQPLDQLAQRFLGSLLGGGLGGGLGPGALLQR